jgi:hypothetical protein
MAMTNGLVPCNKHLCDLVFQVKPHVRQLVEDSNVVSCLSNLFCTENNYFELALKMYYFVD